MTTAEFVASGSSRETSREIMEAIAFVANSAADAIRIWEEPTQAERLAIWERVTKNGLLKSSEFCWGAAGVNW